MMPKRMGTGGWRSTFSYVAMAAAAVVLLPFAIPLTVAIYAIVWLYTWTHDPRARTNLLRVLPLHPRRVYRCSRALWSGTMDGLGGPTVAIIFSYLATKLSRSSRPQDTAVRDIKYGPQAKHRLDLFVPLATQQKHQTERPDEASESEKFPILIIFPGYRWSKTKRARLYRPMAQTLCSDGMFVVLPRIGGVGASLEDILCDFHLTVQWVFENAVNFGGDPKRVHLLGYGAGAHLCTMYSLVVPLKTWYAQADRISLDAQLLASRSSDQCLRQWLSKIKRMPRPVAGLILVSGVFDIVSQRKYETERCIEHLSATSKTFGDRKELEEAWSPSTILRYLRRCSAYIPAELFAQSALLIHGKRDSTFVLGQSQRLFRELCEIDVPDVNMKIYANLRRVDPSIALLAPSSALAMSLLEDIRSSVSLSIEQQDGAASVPQRKYKRGDGDAHRLPIQNATATNESLESAAAMNETPALAPLSGISTDETRTNGTALSSSLHTASSSKVGQSQQRVRSSSEAHLPQTNARTFHAKHSHLPFPSTHSSAATVGDGTAFRRSVDDYFSQPQHPQAHRHSFHTLLSNGRRANLPTVAVSGAK
ncbi:hypothetical protein EV178_002228 [Coemansia sp. RSA 1646]|nr:hypothetical protein EV178_002228 [Coemansia sp. RSA 1646]KAJ1770170.1 hypothetical protein LPJ74_003393 [Coemansia sp. RSA 1843]KAJ2089988.1 hypothetical protein IW138_002957 [Coemansia sp. RSA 986]KAJ2217051.1 hypothetical protein EV179_000818 [Coemansia sp. RSA 487]